MYQIAVCDDEPEVLDMLGDMLVSYSNQHEDCDFWVERFTDAVELLCRITEEGYEPDLLLLDIYMRGMHGMKVARSLREMGKRFAILFITTSRDHALDAFGVGAFQYLVKPVSREKLFEVLDSFLEEKGKKKRYVLLKEHGVKRVEVHSIVYCEAQKKSQYICLESGAEMLLNMTLSKLYEMLSGCPEFVRTGISYIINLEHIDHLNAQEVQMDNGKTIYLPRGAYRNLREQYFEYYCGGGVR